jgi:dihydrodipicolinate synthase/N-acetylneuraminate lyase
MRKFQIQPADWRDVFPVPPLARQSASGRPIDFDQTAAVVRHIAAGGIRNFLYGGNAFLYHITLAEYEDLLGWMHGRADDLWMIPSAGPSFGRAMDQAPLLARYSFPCVMLLPCADPRDAAGLERGYREFAEAAQTPLLVYLKDESNFGPNKEAGLDAVARLVNDGVCVGVKYAVVRDDPNNDAYLKFLLNRVDRNRVLSGMGERPSIVHLRDWNLQGFTTGSGCIAPNLSRAIFDHCHAGNYDEAEKIRLRFLPLEDLRDAWGPARVLHEATELAGLTNTGPIAPYISMLTAEQRNQLAPVAKELFELDAQHAPSAASTRVA